jgi:hypothetical protein
MKILDAIRNRGSSGSSSAETSKEDQLPIPGYDGLDHREVGLKMPELSQVELAAVETYERSHEDRPEVLAKLRYMLTSEPLPDYDTLTSEQVGEALAHTDAKTVKAVRSYERKFGDRREVLDKAKRVLPTSSGSGKQDRAKRKQVARDRARNR